MKFLKLFTATLFAFVSLMPGPALADQGGGPTLKATPQERAKIETVLVDYLEKHPEVVVKAIQEWQRQRQVAEMLPKINMYRDYLEKDPAAPVLGNPDGDVTIVEFYDYRCSFCRRHFPEVMKLVKADGNIRLLPKQFPVLDRQGEAPVSRIAARAALAAQKQGKFADYHIAVMTSPGSLTEARVYEIAASVGLDVERLKEDMGSKILDKSITNSLAVGSDIGFSGTPGYIIGNDVILGAEGYNRLMEAVNRARKAK